MTDPVSTFMNVNTKGVCDLRIPGEMSLNILTEAALGTLTELLALAQSDPCIRVVVVRGSTARAFAGGADIKRMATLDPAEARVFIRRIADACEAIRDIGVPTIAFIEGFCLGAGMELAAACDIRIAATSARFGMPEVRIGIPSVVHACLLPRQIGPAATNWLLMTGEIIDAAQAEKWGFLQFCDEGPALQGVLDRTVTSILESGPNAVRTQKRLLRLWEQTSVTEGVEGSVEEFGKSFESDEAGQYLAAFLAKSRAAKVKA